ncbi:aldehyde dehydrogenase family protein [Chitinilyticum piscinae]|uniref:aldehyde dehydrogenase (NAD(+)) n=1 Tax=Chitinilyticum piscinae TaxID=2866724 RepID=A0A8J7KAR4_9NEIS|nr:aldehyde dehydrogenase family protein [Chitinilyticum piscinae]MBE9609379.1 aldehyde dehydrogenase family protein [Chitinilyticum piscinae]
MGESIWQQTRIAHWQLAGCWPAAVLGGLAHYADDTRHPLKSPIDASELGWLSQATHAHTLHGISLGSAAYKEWRLIPAAKRGQMVATIAEKVRERRTALAALITLESGKIGSEADGEVQEWLDMCDFAIGLSRQLHGLTIASERPAHLLLEQWQPLGVVAVITAFNFPMAVWAWNAMLALVCGNAVIWKPSEKTPLCALAVQQLVNEALADCAAPPALCQLVNGDATTGSQLVNDPRVALISATGSCAMGLAVARLAAKRLARTLLELGGNNAAIVTPSADLELASRAIVFAAAGTCGQRCTSLRRLIVHQSVLPQLLSRLVNAYRSLAIGDPRQPGVLVGPLINKDARSRMQAALAQAQTEGGELLTGNEPLPCGLPDGAYVRPAIMAMPAQTGIVMQETFAPILYVLGYRQFDQAIALNNAVAQGLSSALFSNDLHELGQFIGPAGSDCGLANVNTGTSGAEIGGAFGGEKLTGGGRESGSDAWKCYMRRTTNTLNLGQALPLAQGVVFGLPAAE